jgi:hypothetical protein
MMKAKKAKEAKKNVTRSLSQVSIKDMQTRKRNWRLLLQCL